MYHLINCLKRGKETLKCMCIKGCYGFGSRWGCIISYTINTRGLMSRHKFICIHIDKCSESCQNPHTWSNIRHSDIGTKFQILVQLSLSRYVHIGVGLWILAQTSRFWSRCPDIWILLAQVFRCLNIGLGVQILDQIFGYWSCCQDIHLGVQMLG